MFALGTDAAPRARALPQALLEELLPRVDELARRWAVALVLARPLERFGDVPLAELAQEGPTFLAQMLRALAADAELARLTGDGARGGAQAEPVCWLATLAGDGGLAGIVLAVEALRGVLWEALSGELHESSARSVGDGADRLAFVCASALAAAIALGEASSSGDPAGQRAEPAHASSARALRHEPSAGALIVDERADSTTAPIGRIASTVPPGREQGAAAREELLDDLPPRSPLASLGGEIQIRDERSEEGPAAWIGSIGRELQRFARDRAPFAVLLVEMLEVEQLAHVPPGESSRLGSQVERALERSLAEFGAGAEHGGEALRARAPGAAALTRERPGRYWLLAPTVGRSAAQALAEHLEQAVAVAGSYRSLPLRVAIGTAVCPEDGQDASVLAAHADVGLYAARSAARAAITRR